MRCYSTDLESPDNPHSPNYMPSHIHECHVTPGNPPPPPLIPDVPISDYDAFLAILYTEAIHSSYYNLAGGQFYYSDNLLAAMPPETDPLPVFLEGVAPVPLDKIGCYTATPQANCSWVAIYAVASVIKNRMNKHDQDAQSIISSPYQFSSFPQENGVAFMDALKPQKVSLNTWTTFDSQDYIRAYAYLTNQSVCVGGKGPNMGWQLSKSGHSFPIQYLDQLKNDATLDGIYKGSLAPTTEAAHYISPIAEYQENLKKEKGKTGIQLFPKFYINSIPAKIMLVSAQSKQTVNMLGQVTHVDGVLQQLPQHQGQKNITPQTFIPPSANSCLLKTDDFYFLI